MKKLLLLCASVGLFISCVEDNPKSMKTNEDLLTDKIWEYQQNENETVRYTFRHPNKFYVYEDWNTENQAETESGTWAIEDEKLRIKSALVPPGWEKGLDIKELTETSLKFKPKKLRIINS